MHGWFAILLAAGYATVGKPFTIIIFPVYQGIA
jgi:hypothetical protein